MKIQNPLELIGRFELPTSSLPRVPISFYAVPACAISCYLVWLFVRKALEHIRPSVDQIMLMCHKETRKNLIDSIHYSIATASCLLK